MTTIRLNLGDGSLDDLLAGEYVFRHWLRPDPDDPGAYRLHATVPSDEDGEAWLRALTVCPPDDPTAPPFREPSREVASNVQRIVAWFEAGQSE